MDRLQELIELTEIIDDGIIDIMKSKTNWNSDCNCSNPMSTLVWIEGESQHQWRCNKCGGYTGAENGRTILPTTIPPAPEGSPVRVTWGYGTSTTTNDTTL